MRLRPLAPAGLLTALLTTSLPSEANWPVARHDAHRTGAATGTSNLQKPVPYYRTYLGGSLGQGGLIVADVTGDGQSDILYVTGGRVVAKDALDNTLWQSPPLGLYTLNALEDLDGNGSLELVTVRQDGAVVLAAKTGEVLWSQPAGQIGTLGGARLADLDGDGKKDIVIEECACCGVNSGNPGYIYSFAGGVSQPTLLSKLPFAACGGGNSLSLFDAAPGGGTPKILMAQGDTSTLAVVDPLTGASLAATGPLGTYTSGSLCRPANLDATPGDELVCVVNDNVVDAPDQRRAYALRYTASPEPALSVIWSKTLAPTSGGDLRIPEFLVDLDADGKLEVLLASYDGSTWSTRILDALDGSELATLPGEPVIDWAPIGPSKSIVFFTGGLKAWTFQRQANPAINAAWELPGASTVSALNLAQFERVGRPVRALTIDQDGETLLVVISGGGPYKISTVSAASGAPKTVASYELPADVTPLTLWTVAPTTTPYPQLAMATNDGYLKLFDKALFPVNVDDKKDLQGVRIGGYYAGGGWREFARTPRTMSLDGGKAESIVVADSRGALLRYEASGASLAVPPVRAWQRLNSSTPSLIANLDGGKPGIACVSEGQATVLHADGTPAWQKSVGPILGDLVPATLGADATPDLVVQWGAVNDVLLRTVGLDGANGATLWNEVPYSPSAGRQPAGIAVTDWDGDGTDDVLQQGVGLRVTSGKDGSLFASGGPGDAYFMPIVFDVDGDGTFEVTLHAGFSPARTIRKDFSPVWVGSEDDRPYPYGAIATCASGPVLVEGSWQFPSRLKITQLSGGSAGAFKTTVLASGQAYADQAAAVAAGARNGQLTAANIHPNLTGEKRPIAVVGSDDGYLYAVDPCQAGKIVFTVNFGAAVGEPVFGDSDGDGLDELIVSVADGYLYGLRNFTLPAVGDLIDLPPCTDSTSDQASTTSTETLRASWIASPGAASYEVTAVGPGGVQLAPWTNVGNVTQATISGLTLQKDSLYRFAVRAITATGTASADETSDGVTVLGSSSNGCPGQGTGGASGSSGAAGQGTGGSSGSSGGQAGQSTQGGAAGSTAGTGGQSGAGAGGASGKGGAGGGVTAGAAGSAGLAGATGGSGAPGKSGGGGVPGGGSGGGSGAAPAAPAAAPAGDDGGCGCTTAGSSSARGAWAGLLALAGAAARRRRQRSAKAEG